MPSWSMANQTQTAQLDKELAPPFSLSAQAATSSPSNPTSTEAAAVGPSAPTSTDAASPSSSANEDAAAPGPAGPPNEDAAAQDPAGPPKENTAAPGSSAHPSTDTPTPATSGMPSENQPAPASSPSSDSNMAPPQATKTEASSPAMGDADSLCIIRQINTNEIALAKQMLKRLHHRNKQPMKTARKLAYRIIEDHNIINASLDAVVKKTNIIPATLGTSKNCADIKNAGDALMKKLNRYKGPGLARQFIDDMRQGHSDGQTLVQNLADKASNPDIKAFLLETKGLIHAHESISTQDQEKVNQ